MARQPLPARFVLVYSTDPSQGESAHDSDDDGPIVFGDSGEQITEEEPHVDVDHTSADALALQAKILFASLEGDDITVLRGLLSAGADPNTADATKMTLLYKAIQLNNTAAVELLLAAGAKANFEITPGNTPLLAATFFGFEPIVKLLLRYGAAVNSVDGNGYTALHWAVNRNFTAVAQTLLAAKASVSVANKNRHTALHEAASKKHSQLVYLLLENGADPNAQDDNGVTPLHMASVNTISSDTIIALCSSKRIKPDLVDDAGITALQMAVESKLGRGVKALLDAGADPRLKSSEGLNAIQRAVYIGDIPIFRAILKVLQDRFEETNIKQRLQDSEVAGLPLLSLTVLLDQQDMARELIRYVDLDAVDATDAQTALHLACSLGNSFMAELLIKAGADTTIKDKEGKYPSQLATEPEIKELFKVRAKTGAL